MTYPFRNLVFEGGGVKGIAYVGAMEILAEKGIIPQITRVGGTSAGAINAVLFGLNYSVQDTLAILKTTDFKRFMDEDWGVIRDTQRLFDKFGLYKGDYFRRWIAGIIKQKTGNGESTFGDVQSLKAADPRRGFRDMYFMGTNLSTGFSEKFSHENHAGMAIADAVRISMSIPLFFAAVRNVRGDVFVDGGMLDNYPVKLFDRQRYIGDPANARATAYYDEHNRNLPRDGRTFSPYVYNKETLGFRLDSEQEISRFRGQSEPPKQIETFFDYMVRLFGTLLEFQSSQHLHSDDWHRTVYINTLGVSTTDFGLSDETKEDLRKSGRENTEKYFAWYDNPNEDEPRPVNK